MCSSVPLGKHLFFAQVKLLILLLEADSSNSLATSVMLHAFITKCLLMVNACNKTIPIPRGGPTSLASTGCHQTYLSADTPWWSVPGQSSASTLVVNLQGTTRMQEKQDQSWPLGPALSSSAATIYLTSRGLTSQFSDNLISHLMLLQYVHLTIHQSIFEFFVQLL
jgi:hypothetical protein